jgi:hypothetical protein
MPASPLALLTFGFVLGLRHALDVDHLAAVSTIVKARRSVWSSSLVGALWGVGHTAALLGVGLVVIALHRQIPTRVSQALEFGVALMLIGLGVALLRTLWRGGRLHLHVHEHGGYEHVHPHLHGTAHETGHHHAVGQRPFWIGMVHGLAGSGGLMLAVLATIPSPGLAMGYVLVFGCGSIGGMMAMTALVGIPLALAAERFGRAEGVVRTGAALASVVVGVALAWQIGVDVGLLA